MVAAFVFAAQQQGTRLAPPYLYCGLPAGKSAAHDQCSPNLLSHALDIINIHDLLPTQTAQTASSEPR